MIVFIFQVYCFFCLIIFSSHGKSIQEQYIEETIHHWSNNSFSYRTPSIIPGITLYGAMIVSKNTFYGLRSATTIGTENKILTRQMNYDVLQSQVPFRINQWPAILTDACPQYSASHKKERGLALAHYRIWKDFTYFDPIVANAAQQKKSAQSRNGLYKSINGTLYKNNVPFLEDDIIIILEDDVLLYIEDIETSLIEELSNFNVDFIYLGYCEGRLARPVPLCSHAYAITRKSARKLMKYWEPCGLAIDEQFVVMAKNKWITYRRVDRGKYDKKARQDYSCHGDKTWGIFRQCKDKFNSIMNS